MLPPGAFIGMGLLIALKNVIDSRVKAMQPKAEVVGVTRARITKVN